MPKARRGTVNVATIGFTQTSAAHFFERLKVAGVKKVIDVRLSNASQLAGFAKSPDLAYFLEAIGGIAYEYQPLLCPTDEIMQGLRARKALDVFQGRFLDLMAQRKIETALTPKSLDGACLLCAEAKPHDCHRKLVCDYLNDKWGGALKVTHL